MLVKRRQKIALDLAEPGTGKRRPRNRKPSQVEMARQGPRPHFHASRTNPSRRIAPALRTSSSFGAIRATSLPPCAKTPISQIKRTFVPPVTSLRSPPDSRITGALSPVMTDSSTVAMPSMTSPSPGIMSPTSQSTVPRRAALRLPPIPFCLYQGSAWRWIRIWSSVMCQLALCRALPP